jgi:hypothetical protein
VLILQTDAKSIQCFQNHAKLIENRFSRSKVQWTSSSSSSGNVQRPSSVIIDMYWGVKLAQRKKKKKKKERVSE